MSNITNNRLKTILFVSFYAIFVIMHLFVQNSFVQLPFSVGLLTLFSLFTCPFIVTFFFLFSALGDWGGATGQFLPQMGAFALAHIMLIAYLLTPLQNTAETLWRFCKNQRNNLYVILLISAALLSVVFIRILPGVPAGILSAGVSIYTVLILCMWILSVVRSSWWIRIGATLFLISDFILAWNRFVSPVEMARLQILVPYFLAQGLLFIGISLENKRKRCK